VSVSATEPDWSRETPRRFWDPSRKLLQAIRDYQRRTGLRRKSAVLRHRFWSAVTGADIPLDTSIGGGLMLPHPNGVVIHPRTTIGPNCMIFQQVTLGTNRGKTGAPRLGGHVDVGPGARILGAVALGDHAVVGANAVVLSDVPEGMVAVGVPARILESGDSA
jgi:serine O-acetyltransferase